MNEVHYVLIARIPASDIAAFQAYERVVLPLLPDHGGRLERRMRSADGTLEVHLLAFESPAALDRYRTDPRRVAAADLVRDAQLVLELTPVLPVPV